MNLMYRIAEYVRRCSVTKKRDSLRLINFLFCCTRAVHVLRCILCLSLKSRLSDCHGADDRSLMSFTNQLVEILKICEYLRPGLTAKENTHIYTQCTLNTLMGVHKSPAVYEAQSLFQRVLAKFDGVRNRTQKSLCVP